MGSASSYDTIDKCVTMCNKDINNIVHVPEHLKIMEFYSKLNNYDFAMLKKMEPNAQRHCIDIWYKSYRSFKDVMSTIPIVDLTIDQNNETFHLMLDRVFSRDIYIYDDLNHHTKKIIKIGLDKIIDIIWIKNLDMISLAIFNDIQLTEKQFAKLKFLFVIMLKKKSYKNRDIVISKYLNEIIDIIVEDKLSLDLIYDIELTHEQFEKIKHLMPEMWGIYYYDSEIKSNQGTLMKFMHPGVLQLNMFFNNNTKLAKKLIITPTPGAKITIFKRGVSGLNFMVDENHLISADDYCNNIVKNEPSLDNFIMAYKYLIKHIDNDKLPTFTNYILDTCKIEWFQGYELSGEQFNKLINRLGLNLQRLTNFDECHNGFKFATGLNIDTKTFDPSGSCQAGGLYFIDASEINKWKSYANQNMYWVRSVTLPKNARVYIENNKFKADRLILGERSPL